MDWWTEVGNYTSFFGDTAPALGVDMALHGPNSDFIGYDLAYGLQASPTSLDVYPADVSTPGA